MPTDFQRGCQDGMADNAVQRFDGSQAALTLSVLSWRMPQELTHAVPSDLHKFSLIPHSACFSPFKFSSHVTSSERHCVATVSKRHSACYSQFQGHLCLLSLLGIEPMASYILGQCSPADLGLQLLGHVQYPPSLFNARFFNKLRSFHRREYSRLG